MSEDDQQKRRFPLLLVMVALALLMLLASIAIPAWHYYKHRAAVQATAALVMNLATAMTQYPAKTWTWNTATPPDKQLKTDFLWDLNHDGLIDGTPATKDTAMTDGGFSPDLIASGYPGFIVMARPTIARRFLDQRQQPIDAWGRPLRIAFAADCYGSSWFGIWSFGPDGIDDTADDLVSWKMRP
jgi:hypothetical protein